MNTDLAELIDLLDNERLQIEAAIKLCLDESAYKKAHHHQKALRKVNRKLQTLKHLQDPDYEEKSALMYTQELYKKHLANPKFAGMTDYFLDKMNEDLRKLSAPSRSSQQLDTQEIDDAIFRLVEYKITGFN
jgi:hypothetical protein